jgi:chromosome segregation ATPase
LHSALRQELGSLREQLEEMRRLKDAFEKTGIVEKEKAQRLSSALSQVEADNRDLIARYQQLELRLTHAEAELDTLRRSEKDRSLQLQVLLAPVASGSFCCLTPLAPHLCAAGRAG